MNLKIFTTTTTTTTTTTIMIVVAAHVADVVVKIILMMMTDSSAYRFGMQPSGKARDFDSLIALVRIQPSQLKRKLYYLKIEDKKKPLEAILRGPSWADINGIYPFERF